MTTHGTERRAPKRWTDEEDKVLYGEAMDQSSTGNVKDWHRIAAKLPGRTNKDCRKRWVNNVKGSLKKGAWDEDEDERLLNAVRVHGQKWTLVANEVGARSPDQCAKRWQYNLDPKLEHGGWTAKEDKLLLSSVQKHGREWKFIQEKSYPTRSRNELKNRYTILTRRRNSSHSSIAVAQAPTPAPSGRASNEPEYHAGNEHEDEVMFDYGGFDTESMARGYADPNSSSSWAHLADGDWLGQLDPASSNHHSVALSPPSTITGVSEAYLGELPGVLETNKLDTSSSRINSVTEPTLLSASTFPPLELPTEGSADATAGWGSLDAGINQFIHDPAATMLGVESGSTSTSNLECLDMDSHDTLPGSVAHDTALAMGRVSLVVDQCDRDTLNYLLDVTGGLRGKVRLEIDSKDKM